MQTIIEKCRNLIGDNLITTGRDIYKYESIVTSKVITLTEANIDKFSIVIYKNNETEPWNSGNYSYNPDTGKLIIEEESGQALIVGDILEIDYSYFSKYSDNELEGHIKAALTYLIVEKYGVFTIDTGEVLDPEPTEAEENLIALIASILISGSIRSYRTPEITVVFNDSDSKEKKIKKLIRQFKKTNGILTYIDPTASYETEE